MFKDNGPEGQCAFWLKREIKLIYRVFYRFMVNLFSFAPPALAFFHKIKFNYNNHVFYVAYKGSS